MALTLGTNIASLLAQRSLANNSQRLETVFERLASGQRINGASDDAAGLAVADSLRADARLYGQAYRNVNDGISLLSVADAAITELKAIVSRIQELSQQAASGSYTSAQREVLDAEAQALSSEYARIKASSEFNGINLFSAQELSIQAGIDSSENSRIAFTLDSVPLSSTEEAFQGDGTFSQTSTLNGFGSTVGSYSVGDLNNDGYADVLFANGDAQNTTMYRLGNGDGTFGGAVSIHTNFAQAVREVYLVDLNNDGNLDSVTSRYNGQDVQVSLGNGDGTFGGISDYNSSDRVDELAFGDQNNDGYIDIIAGGASGFDNGAIWLNQGDGTFGAASGLWTGGDTSDIETVDFNNDGNLDLVFKPDFSSVINVRLGAGDGSYGGMLTVYSNGTVQPEISYGDLNNDGNMDLIVEDDNNAQVLLGNGDGTFAVGNSYMTSVDYTEGALTDLDGDGNLDFVAPAYNGGLKTFYGDGTGAFTEGAESSLPSGGLFVQLADADGDGVMDAFVDPQGLDEVHVLLQGSALADDVQQISLQTESEAQTSLTVADSVLENLNTYQAQIGAALSRLEIAGRTAQSMKENSQAAEARIRDADIAADTAELVRLQILQQASAALLAQANQQPSLVLDLLK